MAALGIARRGRSIDASLDVYTLSLSIVEKTGSRVKA